jgi:hypothetical protein
VDSLSSRSSNISSYCKKLLKNKEIRAFVSSDNNYFGNIWHVNQHLVDIIKEYDYICLTDMDLKIINPEQNWIDKLTNILDKCPNIGAVSGDFQPMPPISNNFHFAKDHPELKISDQIDFWHMLTDGWFYTVRASEFLTYLQSGGRNNQFGPGMHGYNSFCGEIGKIIGRTNVILFHYGWLRYLEEWNQSYQESGIKFGLEVSAENDNSYLSVQGNWHNQTKIPVRDSFNIML